MACVWAVTGACAVQEAIDARDTEALRPERSRVDAQAIRAAREHFPVERLEPITGAQYGLDTSFLLARVKVNETHSYLAVGLVRNDGEWKVEVGIGEAFTAVVGGPPPFQDLPRRGSREMDAVALTAGDRQGLIGFVDTEVQSLQVITEDGETFDEIEPGRKGSFVLLIEPGMTVEGIVRGRRVRIRSNALS